MGLLGTLYCVRRRLYYDHNQLCPGLLDLLTGLHHLIAVIIAAIGAGAMGDRGLLALGTGGNGDHRRPIMGSALITPCFGYPSLGNCHPLHLLRKIHPLQRGKGIILLWATSAIAFISVRPALGAKALAILLQRRATGSCNSAASCMALLISKVSPL